MYTIEGLELPDDVTIILLDDNYGYMKRLSSPKEQKRSGRSGVYYHSSYLGKPHDHLWMNTTSPTLMYEELRKAYDLTLTVSGCSMPETSNHVNLLLITS